MSASCHAFSTPSGHAAVRVHPQPGRDDAGNQQLLPRRSHGLRSRLSGVVKALARHGGSCCQCTECDRACTQLRHACGHPRGSTGPHRADIRAHGSAVNRESEEKPAAFPGRRCFSCRLTFEHEMSIRGARCRKHRRRSGDQKVLQEAGPAMASRCVTVEWIVRVRGLTQLCRAVVRGRHT